MKDKLEPVQEIGKEDMKAILAGNSKREVVQCRGSITRAALRALQPAGIRLALGLGSG